MSKRLKVRNLKRNNLPYGKFEWIVTIPQNNSNSKYELSNGTKIMPLRQILENGGTGHWKFDYVLNWRKNKVYTKIFLTAGMDVALLKMCHSELIRKIYKVV